MSEGQFIRRLTDKVISEGQLRLADANFQPSRQDLFELVKYYYRCIAERHLDWFLYGQAGGHNYEMWAWSRILLIEKSAGEEAVAKALEEVDREKERQLGPDLWEIFMTGTEEQWADVREKSWKALNG